MYIHTYVMIINDITTNNNDTVNVNNDNDNNNNNNDTCLIQVFFRIV